jgi:hypothetical protein
VAEKYNNNGWLLYRMQETEIIDKLFRKLIFNFYIGQTQKYPTINIVSIDRAKKACLSN